MLRPHTCCHGCEFTGLPETDLSVPFGEGEGEISTVASVANACMYTVCATDNCLTAALAYFMTLASVTVLHDVTKIDSSVSSCKACLHEVKQ